MKGRRGEKKEEEKSGKKRLDDNEGNEKEERGREDERAKKKYRMKEECPSYACFSQSVDQSIIQFQSKLFNWLTFLSALLHFHESQQQSTMTVDEEEKEEKEEYDAFLG